MKISPLARVSPSERRQGRGLAAASALLALGLGSLGACGFDSVGAGGTPIGDAGALEASVDEDAFAGEEAGSLPEADATASPPVDSGAQDAGKDARPADASSATDAKAAVDSGPLACAPRALAGPPAWSPPSAIHQNVCTLAQVKGLNQACFGADSSGCQAFVTANGACSKCVVTQSTDAKWGPLVDFTGVGATTNIGGCIAAAVTPATSADSTCGADVQRAYGCELSTCAPCESLSHDAYLACTGAADQGACSPWAANRDSCLVRATRNNAARCLGGAPDNDPFINAAMLFCGSNAD